MADNVDLWGHARGHCIVNIGGEKCPCTEYTVHKKRNRHDCATCEHPGSKHPLVGTNRDEDAAKVKSAKVQRASSKCFEEYKVHFQKASGKKMDINGLSVYMVKPTKEETLMKMCCSMAGTTTGKILGGPHGPDLSEARLIKTTVYFRSNEDGDDEVELILTRPKTKIPSLTPKLIPPSNKNTGACNWPKFSDIADESSTISRSRGKKKDDIDPQERALHAAVNEEHQHNTDKVMQDDAEEEPANMSRAAADILNPVRVITIKRKLNERKLRQDKLDNDGVDECVVLDDSEDTGTIKRVAVSITLSDVIIGKEISSGGEGDVCQGTWLGTPVAIKLVRGSLEEEEEEELVNEVARLRTLKHPNVVQFYGIIPATSQRRVGLVVELCSGDLESFAKKMRSMRRGEGQRTQRDVLNVIIGVVRALVYVHKQGIIHGDIKPKNILIQGGSGKLADFGLAALSAQLTTATRTVTWPGTTYYRAPELYSVRDPPTTAADMWSVGITLLDVITGQPSYEKRRFPVASFKTPEPITNKELPNTLKLVGAKNREICQYVVDFDPAKRSSASLWLEQLAKYGPVDGS